jgi:2-haloacid dehalogenase
MTEEGRPSIIVFDVNETLLDLTTLEPFFDRAFGDPNAMREWFAQLILYSQTLTLAGRYVPFGALAGGVLRMVADAASVTVRDADEAELKRLIGAMPALPDVAPALARLKDAGFRLATLTNSPPSPALTPLERAGLGAYFERSFSVDAVGRFKPAPEAYRIVSDAFDVAPSQLCLVACHLWDTIGAQAAGWRGGLLLRPGNAVIPLDGVPRPDIVANDMREMADAIIARWGRGVGR